MGGNSPLNENKREREKKIIYKNLIFLLFLYIYIYQRYVKID